MNKEEFENKVLPLNNRLYSFAFRILKRKEDAEDAIQEVFLKLWKLRNKLEEYRSLEAFAMTVTRNYCLDKIRTTHTVLFEDNYYYNDPIMIDDTEDRKLDLKDAVSHVKDIINNLPEQQRMVIHLRDIEGNSYHEISEIMKENVNTLRVSVSRARTKIREELNKLYQNGSKENRTSVAKIL
jgi:RNA polymerase sigma-70 factor (ECF subfamily)